MKTKVRGSEVDSQSTAARKTVQRLTHETWTTFSEYVVVVVSEPIPGVPSTRLYGTFSTLEEGYEALERAGIMTTHEGLAAGWKNAVVLPIRNALDLLKEGP